MRVDTLTALLTQAKRIGSNELTGKGGLIPGLPRDFEDLIKLGLDLTTEFEIDVTERFAVTRLHEDGPSTIELDYRTAEAEVRMVLGADNRPKVLIAGASWETFEFGRDSAFWWGPVGSKAEDIGLTTDKMKAVALEFRTTNFQSSTED